MAFERSAPGEARRLGRLNAVAADVSLPRQQAELREAAHERPPQFGRLPVPVERGQHLVVDERRVAMKWFLFSVGVHVASGRVGQCLVIVAA